METAMKPSLALAFLLLASALPSQAETLRGAAPGWTFGGDNPENYETGTETMQGMAAGTQVAFIRAGAGAACNKSAMLYQNISAENYRGKRVRLAARLGGERMATLQLFIGIQQPGAKIARFFQPENLNQPNNGVWEWGRAEAVIDMPADAELFAIGFRLGGPRGAGWIDEVNFDVVGDSLGTTVQRMWGQTADQNNFCRGFPNARPLMKPSFGSSANNPIGGRGMNKYGGTTGRSVTTAPAPQ
jgi:hypothetical protein